MTQQIVRIQVGKFNFVELGDGYRDVEFDVTASKFIIDTPTHEFVFEKVPLEIGARVYELFNASFTDEPLLITDLFKFGSFVPVD